jgi:hypothetical protein
MKLFAATITVRRFENVISYYITSCSRWVLRRKIQQMRKYDPMFMCGEIHRRTYSVSEARYLRNYRASVNIGRAKAN